MNIFKKVSVDTAVSNNQRSGMLAVAAYLFDRIRVTLYVSGLRVRKHRHGVCHEACTYSARRKV